MFLRNLAPKAYHLYHCWLQFTDAFPPFEPFNSELVFVNVYRAQESIPPGWESIPELLKRAQTAVCIYRSVIKYLAIRCILRDSWPADPSTAEMAKIRK